MNRPEQPSSVFRAVVAPLPDRRRKRRARLSQPVRVRPSEPVENDFDEVRATTNISRDGIYFVSKQTTYYKGLRVFVTFPYHPNSGDLSLEYIGQVVRIDSLGDDRFGVAVQLLMTLNLQGVSTNGVRNVRIGPF